MIDPSDHTVEEVKAWVRADDRELADSQLADLEAAERDGKNRVTLTEWLEERHAYDPDALTVDTDAPADDHAPRRAGAPVGDDWDQPTLGDPEYDPATHYAWAPGEVPTGDEGALPLVEVAPPSEGSFAGYWFEGGQSKVVRRNKRVDRAIVDGPLQYRGDRPNAAEGDRR